MSRTINGDLWNVDKQKQQKQTKIDSNQARNTSSVSARNLSENLWNSVQITIRFHQNCMSNYTMQYCVDSALQTHFHHCVDIIWSLLYRICVVCGIYCAKIGDLMYSFHKSHLLKQNQMIGHLHRGRVVHLKGVISKFKRYNNKTNNRWHFNRIFTGEIQTTTMTTMWNQTSAMMSGKFA